MDRHSVEPLIVRSVRRAGIVAATTVLLSGRNPSGWRDQMTSCIGRRELSAPTAGDSNRRPGLAMTHGVRARHDQLTNAALAALFGTGPADTTVKESPGGGMPGLPRS